MNLNKILYSIIVVLLSFIFCSCQDTNTDEISESNYNEIDLIRKSEKLPFLYDLQRQKNIKMISTDSMSPAINYDNRFYPELNTYVDYSEDKHCLQFYDFSDISKRKDILFRKEGPKSIPEVNAFVIHNLDSIFILHTDASRIYLSNGKGERVDTYIIKDKLLCGNYDIVVNSSFEFSYIPNEKLLLFYVSPYLSPDKKEGHIYPLVAEYNIEKRKIVNNYGFYPENYRKDKNYFPIDNLGFIIGEKHFIHYFLATQNLYLYDKKTRKLTDIIPIKSKYLPSETPEFAKYEKSLGDIPEQRKYCTINGFYQDLVYDSYRNLYYRLVKHPMEYKNKKGQIHSIDEYDYSIIILDDKFRISNEIKLPAKIYNRAVMFVDKEGLWISVNNFENPENTDDFLKLALFKITKK
jgi:hypothetical protein